MITEIKLSNIQIEAFCGCLPRERTRPVALTLETRIHLELDIGIDPAMDAIENTLDYRRVLASVRHVADSRHFSLVESLAETLAAEVGALHPGILSVEVAVSKPEALGNGVIPTITAVWLRTR